jgi:hypothetical protein
MLQRTWQKCQNGSVPDIICTEVAHGFILCIKYIILQCLPGLANTIQAVTWHNNNNNNNNTTHTHTHTNPKEIYNAYETWLLQKYLSLSTRTMAFQCEYTISYVGTDQERHLLWCDVLCCVSATWSHKIWLCVAVTEFGTKMLNEPITKNTWGEWSTSDENAWGTCMKISGEKWHKAKHIFYTVKKRDTCETVMSNTMRSRAIM